LRQEAGVRTGFEISTARLVLLPLVAHSLGRKDNKQQENFDSTTQDWHCRRLALLTAGQEFYGTKMRAD
jgi:hypothetical protein